MNIDVFFEEAIYILKALFYYEFMTTYFKNFIQIVLL